jgi:hypothetical protein
VIVFDGQRTALPRDLLPGQRARLSLEVLAPPEPGRYLLEVALVHEGYAWFEWRGGRVLPVPVVVS